MLVIESCTTQTKTRTFDNAFDAIISVCLSNIILPIFGTTFIVKDFCTKMFLNREYASENRNEGSQYFP